MTTHVPAADGPRALRLHDPAELLAGIRLSFGELIADALVLVGHAGDGGAPVLARSDLVTLLVPDAELQLRHQLALLREQGCTAAAGVLVIGDGRESLLPGLVEDAALFLGPLLLGAARDEGCFSLGPMWVVGDGTGVEVMLGERSGSCVEVLVSPPRKLRDFEETDVAVRAVLSGESLVAPVTAGPGLEELGRSLRLGGGRMPAFGRPGDEQLVQLLERSGDTIARRCGPGPAGGHGGSVTDCEHLEELLSALALDSVHWAIIGICADRGREGRVPRDELLQTITSDPDLRPHPDVCAGGRWYETLEGLRLLALAAQGSGGAEHRGTAAAAWKGTTVALTVLAWWNHRGATAGHLVEELRIHDPASTLAPLLARLIDTPIRPAWWPER